jgi:arginine utilization protein RocB
MNKQKNIIKLAKELVSIASVVSTSGEKKVAEFIFDWVSKLSYFKNNPTHLIKQIIKNDPLDRFNVIAMINKDSNQDTLVGIAHFDTVDVSDYGAHQDLAFSVDELTEALRSKNDSEDTLYGRGMLDMKSGVAIWMELLKTLSEEKGKHKNLVVSFVFDEEGTSLGMRHAISMLLVLKEEHNLNYLGAIDTDYTTSHYPDDPHRYVYFGTVGKLLISVITVGKETHASDPFLGIDANLMMAHIIDEINLNPKYTDTYQEQTTPPPIILHTQNPKQEYSVKTNKIASTQFNVIMASSSIEVWMQRIKDGVKEALKRTNKSLQERIKRYNENNWYPNKKVDIPFEVKFVDELEGLSFDGSKSDEETLMEYLRSKDYEGGVVVIGLSSPYYPAHTCNEEDQEFVDCIMDSLSNNPIESLKVETYYPYISDLSYLRSPSQIELVSLKKHTFNPTWIDESLWKDASKLNLPMVNIGPYGFDAHKKHERLQISSVGWVYEVIHCAIINEDIKS